MQLYMLIAINIAGFLAVAAFVRWVIRNQSRESGEQQSTRDENIRLLEAQQFAEKRIQALETQLKDRQEQISQLEIDKAKADAKSQSLSETIENERQLLQKAEEKLKDTFKSLAATALEGNNKQFMDLAKSALSKESEVAQKELEKKEQSIEGLLKPISLVLDKYHTHVTEIEKERQKSYNSVEAELRKVIESTASLSVETLALKNALKKPHVRGRWGEVQLKNCIELAGMSEHADVKFQDSQTDEEGKLHIPDMTVRMPGGRIIVVDSKTPIDAFLASLEATTEEQRAAEMTRHGRHVRDHVKKLSQRAYYEGLKESPDFTIMFLPNESFLYAALESEPDLMEDALKKKVLITTPPTLIGLLKVIRYGWNEEKLAENAAKISNVGKELHKRLVEFVDGYLTVGKSLEKAKLEYDKGFNRLERRLISKAREMEALGAKSTKSLPDGVGDSELSDSTAPLKLEAPSLEDSDANPS
jgi:DNA recombination protein RmuC